MAFLSIVKLYVGSCWPEGWANVEEDGAIVLQSNDGEFVSVGHSWGETPVPECLRGKKFREEGKILRQLPD